MNAIALLWQDVSIHWSGIFAALGAVSGGLLLGSLLLFKGQSLRSAAAFFPAAVLFSLVFSRLCHWYCHPLQYTDFVTAMTDYSVGGFALPGAFVGTMLAAGLVRLSRLTEDFPGFLDALAPAAALALAVGRLGAFFDNSCRGSFLPKAPWLQSYPLSVPVETAGGSVTWHFATFFYQALWAALLCMVCMVLLFTLRRPEKGHVFALFLSFYSAGQLVLDSTRYDAHFLRSNGFVHVTQLGCIAMLAGIFLLYAVAAYRRRGFRRWMVGVWIAFPVLGGLGGYMEYFVQRHGDRFALAYPVMAGCFGTIAILTVILFRASKGQKTRRDTSS